MCSHLIGPFLSALNVNGVIPVRDYARGISPARTRSARSFDRAELDHLNNTQAVRLLEVEFYLHN